MKYRFEDLSDKNHKEWDKALKTNHINNPFQSGTLFMSLQGNNSFNPYGRIIREISTNEIVGGYCFFICRELKGPLGALTTRVILNGGPVQFIKSRQLLQIILDDLTTHPKFKGVYLEIWHDQEVEFLDMYEQMGFYFIPHLNFFIHLNQSEKNIWEKINKRRRRYITKFSSDLEIRQVKNLMDFQKCYLLIKNTYKRIKLPLFEEKVFADVFSNNNCFVYLAEKEDIPIATRIILKFNHCLYDWFAGDDRSEGNLHASDCIIWEVLKYGIKNGYNVFNFGGAGHPNKHYGPRDYKATFGGELVGFGRHRYVLSKKTNHLLKISLSVRHFLTENK